MNGLVVEFGRKLKAPEDEEIGVVSYTKLWGTKQATVIWMLSILITLVFATLAGFVAGFGITLMLVLIVSSN
jgi:4-hydroxybenzoate polyprenyltransferase